MSLVRYYSYYVGHGAMNFFEVCSNSGSVEMKILIDAGTKCDKSYKKFADVHYNIVKNNILNCESKCIFCLTHPHEDHYSYMCGCISELENSGNLGAVEKIFIGGLKEEQFRYIKGNEEFIAADKAFLDYIKHLFDILGPDIVILCQQQYVPDQLWSDNDGANLYMLYNGVIHGDANDLGAGYVVKNGKNMVWVTGDSTGSVFNYYLRNVELALILAEIFGGASQVYITAPHHGSIHTLSQADFIYNDEDQQLSSLKWETLIHDFLGIKKYRLILGSCPDDKFKNPDLIATEILLSLCEGDNKSSYWWDVYDTYGAASGSSTLIRRDNGNWYWYRKKNPGKYVYPTAKCSNWDDNDYDVQCTKLIL